MRGSLYTPYGQPDSLGGVQQCAGRRLAARGTAGVKAMRAFSPPLPVVAV
jgi:hypothetical protein